MAADNLAMDSQAIRNHDIGHKYARICSRKIKSEHLFDSLVVRYYKCSTYALLQLHSDIW